MAISDTIQSMQTNLGNAYDTIENKGGTLPQNKNLANLSTAIDSIPAGSVTLPQKVDGVNDTNSYMKSGAGSAFSINVTLAYTIGNYSPLSITGVAFGYKIGDIVLYEAMGAIVKNNTTYTVFYGYDNNTRLLHVGYVNNDWSTWTEISQGDIIYLVNSYTGYQCGWLLVKAADTNWINFLPISNSSSISGSYNIYRGYGEGYSPLIMIDHNLLELSANYVLTLDFYVTNGYLRVKANVNTSVFFNKPLILDTSVPQPTSGFTVEVTAENYGVAVFNGIYSTETGDYSGTYLGEATENNSYIATISVVGTENGVDYGYISVACGDTDNPNRIQAFPTISANLTLMADLSGTDPDSQYDTSYVYKVTGNGTMSVDAYCMVEGTQITLADGSTKSIEDITYEDELLVWDFYEGKLSTAKPKWIMQESKANEYNLVKFSNGTSIGFVGDSRRGYHRIFNQQAGAFTHTGVAETPIGTLTYDQHGYFPEVISQEIVKGEVKYYNVITDKHFNLFANGILTSCRLSNKYKIEEMKYTGKELISAKEEENYFKKIERRKK